MKRYYSYALIVLGTIAVIGGVSSLPKRSTKTVQPLSAMCMTPFGPQVLTGDKFKIELHGPIVTVTDSEGQQEIMDLSTCFLSRKPPQ